MGKKSSKKKKEQELNRILDILEQNQFFHTIDTKTFEIYFYEDFYFFLKKLIETGKDFEEALKILGLDFDIIGKELEEPIINHLYELIQDEEYGTRESDFSGTTDEKIIDELHLELNLLEEVAFKRAKLEHLRNMIDKKSAQVEFLKTLEKMENNSMSDDQ